MNKAEVNLLRKTCRQKILFMTTIAGSGHLAGPLGVIDILIYLFIQRMGDTDDFVLSCAHMVPALYAILNSKGLIDDAELGTLRKFGSRLQGHTTLNKDLRIPTCGGSLGQGVGYATGMAFAKQVNNDKSHVYCLISDGELNEGSVYECLLFINKFKLNNITILLDRNNIQQTGFGKDVMPLPNLKQFFGSFANISVSECNGNDLEDLEDTFAGLDELKPNIIICNTVAGKGIKRLENNPQYHAKVLTQDELKYTLSHEEEWTLN